MTSWPLIVLLFAYLAIIFRQIIRINLSIWQIMFFGAVLVLIPQSISIETAVNSIDWYLIIFILGMCVIGGAMEESGLLVVIIDRLIRGRFSLAKILLVIIFGMGIASAFFINDILAIVGTPLVLSIAKKKGLAPQKLLLLLAFSVTLGSVFSPMGNPQNIYIAFRGVIEEPFGLFFHHLALPTFINLVILFLIFMIWKPKKISLKHCSCPKQRSLNRRLAIYCVIALGLICLLMAHNIVAQIFGIPFSFPLPAIALIPSIFLLIFSKKRKILSRKIDWRILVFFASMFILMRAVWDASNLEKWLLLYKDETASLSGVLVISTLLSQLISNVPLVALYLPFLVKVSSSPTLLMALAAGSTVAGNLFFFGAASNLIIMQRAEREWEESISALTFLKYGVPITVINLIIYWFFLSFM